jgi:hypothetical protein
VAADFYADEWPQFCCRKPGAVRPTKIARPTKIVRPRQTRCRSCCDRARRRQSPAAPLRRQSVGVCDHDRGHSGHRGGRCGIRPGPGTGVTPTPTLRVACGRRSDDICLTYASRSPRPVTPAKAGMTRRWGYGCQASDVHQRGFPSDRITFLGHVIARAAQQSRAQGVGGSGWLRRSTSRNDTVATGSETAPADLRDLTTAQVSTRDILPGGTAWPRSGRAT